MSGYKDKKNFVPHDINNFVFTVDGDHKIEGLESIVASYDDEHFAIETVADGMGIPVKNPSRKGTVTLTILEASPSNSKMWALYNAAVNDNTGFQASGKDSASPDFNISETYFYPQKPHELERSGEAKKVEWVLVAVYLNLMGGGYKLQAV